MVCLWNFTAENNLQSINKPPHLVMSDDYGLFSLSSSSVSPATFQLCSIFPLKLYKRTETFIKWWSYGHPRQSLDHQMAGEHLHGQSGPANETRWARTVHQPFQPRSVSTLLMKRPADGEPKRKSRYTNSFRWSQQFRRRNTMEMVECKKKSRSYRVSNSCSPAEHGEPRPPALESLRSFMFQMPVWRAVEGIFSWQGCNDGGKV